MTWRFNEQDGHRNYFWGHYMNEPDMAERDLLNRAEDYQRRYHVQEVEQAPDKETYLYYSTQRPIDIGTYPNRKPICTTPPSGLSTSAHTRTATLTALFTWIYTLPASK